MAEQSIARPIDTVRDLLEKSKAGLAAALPKHIDAAYLIRVTLTSVQRTPALLECYPLSLLGAVFQAAQLGLIPDGVLGQAYLVPYKNKKKGGRLEAQLIPGYKGLIALARRSGEVTTIDARVVHKKDHFVYTFGVDPKLEHRPTDDAEPGPVTHVYCVAKLKDGGYQLEVMTRREVEAVRARSKSPNDGPWVTDWDWMAKKTVIKQVCKLLPSSTELQRAIALEERADVDLPQDLALLADPNEPPTTEDGPGGEDRTDPIDRELHELAPDERAEVLRLVGLAKWNAAQTLVQLRGHRGRSADLLAFLRATVGEPDVIDASSSRALPAHEEPEPITTTARTAEPVTVSRSSPPDPPADTANPGREIREFGPRPPRSRFSF